MFGSLRNKLQSVQEGISASFRNFSEQPRRQRPDGESNSVDFGAGANLLHKYQCEWSEIHRMSETNAAQAEELDALIGSLDRELGQQLTSVGQLTVGVTSLPQLLSGVQGVMEDIGALRQRIEDVEGGLAHLQDTVETQELQEKQLDHRFQLAMYKEKKLGELEKLRESLVSTHSAKLALHEQKKEKVSKERQETFDEAFRQDVQLYRQSGAIPRSATPARNLSLEEVTLEPEDSSDLDRFLSSGEHHET